MSHRYWLMKSEPDEYSIDDLQRDGHCSWEGVRNFQARNFMRDDMKQGDPVLFYHSSITPPGVAGIARVCKEAYPDHSAQDRKSAYHDPKASKDNPIWMMVDVEFVERFPQIVTLEQLKAKAALSGMPVLKRGMRLSIQPVEQAHFELVRKMGRGR